MSQADFNATAIVFGSVSGISLGVGIAVGGLTGAYLAIGGLSLGCLTGIVTGTNMITVGQKTGDKTLERRGIGVAMVSSSILATSLFIALTNSTPLNGELAAMNAQVSTLMFVPAFVGIIVAAA